MMFWKSKRERDLEDAIKLYQKMLGDMKKRETSDDLGRYVHVPAPKPEEVQEYQRRIAAFIEDRLYLFYLAQLRREVVDQFQNDRNASADYYRGKLAVIGDLISDGQRARSVLNGAGVSDEI